MERKERMGWFGRKEEAGETMAERVVMGRMMFVWGRVGECLATRFPPHPPPPQDRNSALRSSLFYTNRGTQSPNLRRRAISGSFRVFMATITCVNVTVTWSGFRPRFMACSNTKKLRISQERVSTERALAFSSSSILFHPYRKLARNYRPDVNNAPEVSRLICHLDSTAVLPP
ncbi:hypothetical protein CRYUN_Cryun04dG0077600 [Craigia yunnanensis]